MIDNRWLIRAESLRRIIIRTDRGRWFLFSPSNVISSSLHLKRQTTLRLCSCVPNGNHHEGPTKSFLWKVFTWKFNTIFLKKNKKREISVWLYSQDSDLNLWIISSFCMNSVIKLKRFDCFFLHIWPSSLPCKHKLARKIEYSFFFRDLQVIFRSQNMRNSYTHDPAAVV